MVCFSKVFCPCFSRRRRAGSSRGGSSVSDRPSSERRLGNGQPEAQEGGESQQEVELPNRDAAEQPQAPRVGPQPADSIVSFPRLDESPDGDNPSNDVSRQDPPQRDTGIAPQANGTQANIGGPSNNVSVQGAPQHGTPKPRSRRESRSTAAGPNPPFTLRDLVDRPRGSSASAPQANDTQTNVSNPSNNISQQGTPQHSTPKPRSRRESHSTAAGPYVPLLLSDLLKSPRSSSASAPRANDTQTNVSNPSNDVSQNDNPMPGSAPGSHSTATGPFPEYEDPVSGNQDTGSPSDGAPQANDTQTDTDSPSNDVESTSSSPDGINSVLSDDSESSSSSLGSESSNSSLDGDSQANGCKPPDDKGGNTGSSDGAPPVINTQTNVSNPSDNISQQGAPQHGTPKPRIKLWPRRTAAGSLTPGRDLLGGFLNSVSSSLDSAPPVINTQTNVSNPSDNISQQGAPKHGAPKHGTPKPRSRRGSRSIAAGSVATCTDLLGGFLESASGSSDVDPQANDCNPSNDVESASDSSDGARQANKTQTDRAQNSSGSQRGQDPILSEKEREILGLLNLFR
ncbi:hypothetical protein FNAPI_8384 [Fusarium napiforme]|uniref:Uncharacterized protein n=1 Tax=Fusarium napiforme TaxID=42672 RepID=A0A8H5J311_9HYPO|nr:hypothetical protein FNAPI_8384 [Fusarium napiforme]